jgi:acyl-CoA thioesterase FadM
MNQKGELCAEVKTVHVFINKQTWKTTKMDTEIKEGLRKHLSEN